MQNQTTKAAQNIAFNFLGRLGSQIIGLVVSIYVIRQLSVETYGEYSILLSILTYVTVLASLGLTNVFQRFIPEFSAKKQFTDIKHLVGLGIGARFLVGISIVGLLMLLAQPIGNWLHVAKLPTYLQVYGSVIVLTLVVLALDVALTSLLRQFATNSALLLATVLRAAGFYYVIGHDYGLLGLLVVELIAVGARLTVLLLAYAREVHGFAVRISEQNPDTVNPKRIMRFGGWAYLNELGFIFFNTDTDNFIISSHLGSAAVGVYAFANRIANMFLEWSPIAIAANVISPLFFDRYTRTQSTAELDRMFGMLNKASYVVLVPMLTCLAAVHGDFVGLVFGEKYVAASWLVVGVLFYQVLNAYQFPLGLVVFAVEQNQINFYSRAFSLYNLVADLILVRFWGVPGVLIATASAVTLKNLFIYWRITKRVRLRWEWRCYAKILVNAVITGVLLWLCRPLYVNFVWLGLTLFAAAVVYVALTLIYKVFSASELDLVNQALHRQIIPVARFSHGE
jgi:O-antigen/teichoic acid export membrane protein